jgi:hypothetical protein
VLVNVALHKDGGHIWIETNCEQHGGEFQCLFTENSRGVCRCESVEIDDAVIHVGVVLACNPVGEGPKVVP